MIRKTILIVSLKAAVALTCFSQSEQLAINLAPSATPRLFIFENPKGSVRITGYEGDVILVTGTLRYSGNEKPVTGDLHRIGQKSFDLTAEEEGGNITLLCRTSGKTIDFDIKVPRDISLKIRSLDNGKIEIVNINGEIDAENSGGDINLENIAGSAVLSSVYGKISAVFRKVNPGSPMMFTSLEGDISITLPESVNATLKLKSDRGEILSDFDVKPSKRQPVVTTTGSTTVYSLEDWITGSLNEGGPEYIIKTYNGSIILKKRKEIM